MAPHAAPRACAAISTGRPRAAVGDVHAGGAGEEAAEDGAHGAARRLLQPPHHGAPLLLLLPPAPAAPTRLPVAEPHVLSVPALAAADGAGNVARAADRSGIGGRRGPSSATAALREEGEHGGALPDAAEARHGALGHGLLLLGEGVAAEVHLPARVAVHHPRARVPRRQLAAAAAATAAHAGAAAVAVVVGRAGAGALLPSASASLAPRHGHRLDELGVGLGPLVQADVAGPHRRARVHAADGRLAPGRH
jgi:hypothetical protein